MKKLMRWMFPDLADFDLRLNRLASVEADNGALKTRNATLWESVNERDKTIAQLQQDNTKLKEIAREQNDADLMLACANVIVQIVNGKKPAPDSLQSLAFSQQAAMQNSSLYHRY